MTTTSTGSRLRLVRAALAAVLLAGATITAQATGASAAVCPEPGGSFVPEAATPTGAPIVLRGHGKGDGLGMSQYGAKGAATLGCTADQVLDAYYPGTTTAPKSLGPSVTVLDGDEQRITVEAVSGGGVPWIAGGVTKTQLQGSTWTVARSQGNVVVRNAGNQTVLTVPPGKTLRIVENGRVVRVTHRTSSDATRLVRWDETRVLAEKYRFTITQLFLDTADGTAVQKYLWGLDAMASDWPTEALRAQAIAARSFLAFKGNRVEGAGQLGLDTPFPGPNQVYAGYARESSDASAGGQWKAAVDDTAGLVRTDSTGAVIRALYSPSFGGRSEDLESVTLEAPVPYLRSVDDTTWDLASDDPYRSWAVGRTRADLGTFCCLWDDVDTAVVGAPGTPQRRTGVALTGQQMGGGDVSRTMGLALFAGLNDVPSTGLRIEWLGVGWRQFGRAISGDWNGDGTADVGWYQDGVFSLRLPNGTTRTIDLGTGPEGAVTRVGGVPVVGDWDGDGTDGVGTFRDGKWAITDEPGAANPVRRFVYGTPGTQPVVGRWTGATPLGIGVVRGQRYWSLRKAVETGATDRTFIYRAGDLPLLGDWDGNGLATPGGVFRARWTLSSSVSSPNAWKTPTFGRITDMPFAGDFDGNGSVTTGTARSGSFFWRNDLKGGTQTAGLAYAP
ncbi:hypothetical protein GCM10027446_15350 [Angustibacter peucedani]